MFTGIIEQLGTVAAIEQQPDAIRLTLDAPEVLIGAQAGDSISVNGCCLTIVSHDGRSWTADVMAETLSKTTLGGLRVGDRVNLEPAAMLQTRMGGHLVQGHVDGVGQVIAREVSNNWTLVSFALPPTLSRYLVEKGSITVDGVSLTVVTVGDDEFTVSLIPETLARTTLGWRQPGEAVNLEVDILAKYVERLLDARLKEQS